MRNPSNAPGNAVTILAVATALAACTPASDTQDEAPTESATQDEDENLQNASLGPLTYEFDRDRLTPADIDLSIPPSYEMTHRATKLIPADRARNLGQTTCEYGQSGLTSECNAAQETGLAIALLPRPSDEYRQAFLQSDIPEDELSAVGIDAIDGFAFTAQAEGAGIEYRFFALNERTILLARSFDENRDVEASDAIADALRTLEDSIHQYMREDEG